MGKNVTPQQLEEVIEGMVKDASPVSGDSVLANLHKYFGDNWTLTKTPPVKFTKDDINAVANGRFYRKTGIKMLLVFAIVVLGIYILMTVFTSIAPVMWFSIYGLVGIFFMYLYSRKQREVRKELWKGIKGEGQQEG
jgi:hypothetical protein